MSTRVVASIPPQPSCLELSKTWGRASPLHLSGCCERLVYGVSTGVVVRRIPGEIMIGASKKSAAESHGVRLYGVSKRPITCATCSKGEKVIVGGDNDGCVHVWIRSAEVKYRVYKLDDMRYVHLTDVAITADAQRIAVVGYDKHSTVHGAVIQAETGSRIGIIRGHSGNTNNNGSANAGGISSVTFSPCRPYHIATGGFDGRICLHQGPPYKLVKSCDVGCASVTCLRYSPDGRHLAVLGSDGYLALYSPDLELITDADLGSVTPLSCDWRPSATSSVFAVACDDRSVHILRIDESRQTINVMFNINLAKDQMPRGILWSRNEWIIVPLESGAIFGWNLNSKGSSVRLPEIRMPQNANSDVDTNDSASTSEERDSGVNTTELPLRYDPDAGADVIFYGPRGGASVIDYDLESKQLMIGTSLGYIMFLDAGRVIPQAYDVSQMGGDRKVKGCLSNGTNSVAVAMNGSLKFFKYVPKGSNSLTQKLEGCLQIMNGIYEVPKAGFDVTIVKDVVAGVSQPLSLVYIGSRSVVGLFSSSGSLNVYDITTGRELWNVRMATPPLLVSATSDGTLLCVAVEVHDGYEFQNLADVEQGEMVIEVYEILDGTAIDGFRFIKVIPTGETKLSAIAVNTEGSLVAYTSGTYIRVKELDSDCKLLIDKQWGDHRTRVCDLCWSPSAHRLLSTSTGEIFVWNVDEPCQTVKVVTNHSGYNLFSRFLYENVIVTGGSEGLLNIHKIDY